MEEWRNGGMEEWRNGGMEEWRNGGMEAWREGWRNGGSVAEGLAGCVKSSFGSLWQLVGVCGSLWEGGARESRGAPGGFQGGRPQGAPGSPGSPRGPQGAPGSPWEPQ